MKSGDSDQIDQIIPDVESRLEKEKYGSQKSIVSIA